MHRFYMFLTVELELRWIQDRPASVALRYTLVLIAHDLEYGTGTSMNVVGERFVLSSMRVSKSEKTTEP